MQNNPDMDTSGYWRRLLKIGDTRSDTLNIESIFRDLRGPFRALTRFFLSKYLSLRSTGIENLPCDPPYIIASNHSSSLDFPAVLFCLPKEHQNKICAMYKSLFNMIPFARFIIKLFVPSFSVNLQKEPWGALSTAVKALAGGYIVYIAPEGTRSKSGELLPFKPGIGAVAVETGTSVVPVFISGASKALPSGSLIPKRHPVTVMFGKPINTLEYSKKKSSSPAYDIYKELAGDIRSAIIDLGKVSSNSNV
jgi:1-acyl-sn-glycerol-3-phosphate acyltransferase